MLKYDRKEIICSPELLLRSCAFDVNALLAGGALDGFDEFRPCDALRARICDFLLAEGRHRPQVVPLSRGLEGGDRYLRYVNN